MFGSGDATTEVARMWFMAYIFLVTMLCSDLFVGVIVSLYADAQSIKSSRLSVVFARLLELPPQSRVGITKSVLKLNRELECLSHLITDAEVGNCPKLACLEEYGEGSQRFTSSTSHDLEQVIKPLFASTVQAVAMMVGISEQDQHILMLDQEATCIERSSVQVLWNLMMGFEAVGEIGQTASSFVLDCVSTNSSADSPSESKEEYADTLSDWMMSFVAVVRDDCVSQFIDLAGFESDSLRADA